MNYLPSRPINKLVTNEDPYHLHKTLGLLSLINLLYRYMYILPLMGTLGYETISNNNTVTVAVHTLLPTSSLIFKVLTYRLAKKPLIIYKEYQLHTILFTLRSVLPYTYDCIAYHAGYRRINVLMSETPYIPFLAIMSIHMMADIVTRYHGTSGMTTIRCSNKSTKLYQLILRRTFSFYQFLAIGTMLAAKPTNVSNLGFNALLGIQSSAFLMTLARKNLISSYTYLSLYLSFLGIGTVVMCKEFDVTFFLLCMCVFGGRIMGISKYILWSGFHCYYIGYSLTHV
jgi:hypothetical protein